MIYCGFCCGSDPSVFSEWTGDQGCGPTTPHPILLRVGAVTERVSFSVRTNRGASEIDEYPSRRRMKVAD